MTIKCSIVKYSPPFGVRWIWNVQSALKSIIMLLETLRWHQLFFAHENLMRKLWTNSHYRRSPLSTNSLSTIPGIVWFKIVLKSTDSRYSTIFTKFTQILTRFWGVLTKVSDIFFKFHMFDKSFLIFESLWLSKLNLFLKYSFND
jgi:hypothetical protein